MESGTREIDDLTFGRMTRGGSYASTGGAATSDSRGEVDVLFRGGHGWSGGGDATASSGGGGGSGGAGGGAGAASGAASSADRPRARSAAAVISVLVSRRPPKHDAALSSPSSLSDMSLPSLLSMGTYVDDGCSHDLTARSGHEERHKARRLEGAARRGRSAWSGGGRGGRSSSGNSSDGRDSAFTAETYTTMTTAGTMTTNTNTTTTGRIHNNGSNRSIVQALTSASSSSFSARSRSFRSPLFSPVPIRFAMDRDGNGGCSSGGETQSPSVNPCPLVKSAAAEAAGEVAEEGKGSRAAETAVVPAWDTVAIVKIRAVGGGLSGVGGGGDASRFSPKPYHSATTEQARPAAVAGQGPEDDLEAGRLASSAHAAPRFSVDVDGDDHEAAARGALSETVEVVVERDSRLRLRSTPLCGLTAFPSLPPILVSAVCSVGGGFVVCVRLAVCRAACLFAHVPTDVSVSSPDFLSVSPPVHWTLALELTSRVIMQ